MQDTQEQEIAPAHRSLGSLTMGHPEYTAPLRVDLTPRKQVSRHVAGNFGYMTPEKASKALADGIRTLKVIMDDGPAGLALGNLLTLADNLATALNN